MVEPQQLHEGDIVEVTHPCSDGESVVYKARLHFDSAGRTYLERLKDSDLIRLVKARITFNATYPIPGYQDWYMISAIPVLLGYHVRSVRCAMAGLARMAPAQD